MTLGELIRQYREKHGLSMRKFADKSGVSHSHIRNIERGTNTPKVETLELIAKAMDMGLEALMTETGLVPDRGKEILALEELLQRTDIHLYLGGKQLTGEEKEDVIDFLRLVLKMRHRKDGSGQ